MSHVSPPPTLRDGSGAAAPGGVVSSLTAAIHIIALMLDRPRLRTSRNFADARAHLEDAEAAEALEPWRQPEIEPEPGEA